MQVGSQSWPKRITWKARIHSYFKNHYTGFSQYVRDTFHADDIATKLMLHLQFSTKRAFSTNNRPKSIFTKGGINFINCWDNFYNKPLLFKNNDLHLNSAAAARLGRQLSSKVSDFRRKNNMQPCVTETLHSYILSLSKKFLYSAIKT